MDSEELDQICFNCNHFFPDKNEITEYGICLDDEEFSPYIEELLDNLNFAVCQDLIDKKRIPGDHQGCDKFEAAEILEVEDDSPLEKLLNTYKEKEEIDQDN